MKKSFYREFLRVVVGTFIGAMILVAGCGNSGQGTGDSTVNTTADTSADTAEDNSVNADVSAKGVADAIKDGGEFKDQLAELDTAVAVARLYSLDESKIEEASFYTNTNATAEEIAVVKVNDSSYTDAVVEAYNKRIENQKEACEDYLPDEMPKLSNAVVKAEGNYVILCISCDSDKITEILDSIF